MNTIRKVGAALIVALPLSAAAQSGVIITSPVAFPAPTLNAWMLLLLCAGLGAGAVWMLRRGKFSAASQFAVVLAVGALAGIGYATTQTIIVSGDECNRTAQHPFDPDLPNGGSLTNECTNAIRVVTIDFSCNGNETLGGGAGAQTLPNCSEGIVLQSGEGCLIPNPCYD